MDGDDDIYVIFSRTTQYLDKLKSTIPQLNEERIALLHTCKASPIPRGFTKKDWKSLDTHLEKALALEQKLSRSQTQSKQTCASQLGASTRDDEKHDSSPLTYKAAHDMIERIKSLGFIDFFDQVRELFMSQASDIMDQYARCIENPIHSDFMNTKRADANNEKHKLKRKLISTITDILGDEVVSQVINRKMYKMQEQLARPVVESSNHEEEEEEGSFTTDDDMSGMVYTDLSRISMNQKYKYDKRQHFRDTINQYQGLQHKQISPKVIDDVIEMIKNHGLFNEHATDPKEQFDRVTKEHIRMFLEESGHNKSYEDLHLIHHKITGKPCANIQKYEAMLYEDFDPLVEVFLTLPVDRKNFLSNYYVLTQLLRRRGVFIPDQDLSILKTPSRLRTHDDIYQACCQKLGWNFRPL